MNAANDASGASDTGPHNDGNNIVYELWRVNHFTHIDPSRQINLAPVLRNPVWRPWHPEIPNFVTTYHLSWRRSPFHFLPHFSAEARTIRRFSGKGRACNLCVSVSGVEQLRRRKVSLFRGSCTVIRLPSYKNALPVPRTPDKTVRFFRSIQYYCYGGFKSGLRLCLPCVLSKRHMVQLPGSMHYPCAYSCCARPSRDSRTCF